MTGKLPAILAWAGVILFIIGCLAPVAGNWSGSVPGPFGGIDPMLQLGILQWSCLHWHEPGVWMDLPIFHPETSMLGCMDSLLGQAWMIWPMHLLLGPTAAAQYNLAVLGSLLLGALGMAALWRASGGGWLQGGFAALAMVGAPYTISQLGHLNQLPPPFVLFGLAALFMGLRRRSCGLQSWPWWWAVGAALVLQAAWGWYGFAFALVAIAVVMMAWLAIRIRTGQGGWGELRGLTLEALAPAVLAGIAVILLAQPQLELSGRYSDFTRSSDEVRSGSADIQHILNRGAYRGGPQDWIGKGVDGPERYKGKARQTLNPGWIALALAAFGWNRRKGLPDQMRSSGVVLLLVGLVGLVLAFGDSVGLPGTDRRLPMPLEWMRSVAPPFRAFRGAWRFSWLLVVAVSWWGAVGMSALAGAEPKRRYFPVGAVALLALVSFPGNIPSVSVGISGRPGNIVGTGPILTLPAPVDEYAEDRIEALWIARAIELGAPVTGGATGWVPPPIVAFRDRLHQCEQGQLDPLSLLEEWKAGGYWNVELACRPGDQARLDFWRGVLGDSGAVLVALHTDPDYELYSFDPENRNSREPNRTP